MATLYASTNGNWDDTNLWATTPGGGGSVTIAANASTSDLVLNGKNVALTLSSGSNVSPNLTANSIAATTAGGTTAGGTIGVGNSGSPILNVSGGISSTFAGALNTWGTGTCSLTIYGNVTISTSTGVSTGVLVFTGQTLIINGEVICSSGNSNSNYDIVGSSGTLTIANSGSTAIGATNHGNNVLNASGTATVNITGNVSFSGSGAPGAIKWSSSGTFTFNGNGAMLSGGTNGFLITCSAGTVNWTPTTGVSMSVAGTCSGAVFTGGTVNIIGNVSTLGYNLNGPSPIFINGATVNLLSYTSLPSSSYCDIGVYSGTLNLASTSAASALLNSGNMCIRQTSSAAPVNAFVATVTPPVSTNWTFTFNGQTTSSMIHNITLANLKTAVELLSSVGSGNSTITGTPGTSYVISIQAPGTASVTGTAATITSYSASITNQNATAQCALLNAPSVLLPLVTNYSSGGGGGLLRTSSLDGIH